MAKKLNDPSKGYKNLGRKQRGIGMLINTKLKSFGLASENIRKVSIPSTIGKYLSQPMDF